PNFAFDLCLERIEPDELTGLDLRTWRIAFNAAEPIQARTLDEFAAFFAPVGFRKAVFYPSYGMAEATVFLTGGKTGTGPVVRELREIAPDHAGADKRQKLLIGCGLTATRHALKIVDPGTL